MIEEQDFWNSREITQNKTCRIERKVSQNCEEFLHGLLRPHASMTLPPLSNLLAREHCQNAIDHATHYLPAQGPIDVFIHHNTLHAFEEEPFEEALIHASHIFGTEPFLTETRYREELAQGRIRSEDVDAVLDAESLVQGDQQLAGGRITRKSLHRAILFHAIRQEDDTAVRWTLTESNVVECLRTDLDPSVRRQLLNEDAIAFANVDDRDSTFFGNEDDAVRRETFARGSFHKQFASERRVASELWHACVEAVALTRPSIVHVRPPVRHRDLIKAIEPSLDLDAFVNPLLIRWSAAFLDQGIAAWPMPGRERGLFEAVSKIYSGKNGPLEPWNIALPDALQAAQGMDPIDVIVAELERLGIPQPQWQVFIRQSLLSLRGWAGMIYQIEQRPDRVPVVAVPARLADFLALRLMCDRVAVEWAAQRLWRGVFDKTKKISGLWIELQDRYPPRRGPGGLSRAFLLHQISQVVGLTARNIRALDENELIRLESAIAEFNGVARRRIFHLAFERHHRIQILDALASQVRVTQAPVGVRPQAQAIFCIDERCESFRRHFEELGSSFETFGTAGFFAVAMYYRGIDDWHTSPLCPIVIRPKHTVLEVPETHAEHEHRTRQAWRRRYGTIMGTMSNSSRTLVRGGLFTALAGAIAAVPLVARVVFPRFTARLGATAAEISRKRVPTRLLLEKRNPHLLPDGTHSGFDVNEMTAIVRRVLEDIGLTKRFARLVAVLGHGSASLNNPHESAYDCGACGGGRGGPNARAFATMANDPRIRRSLADEGLLIPEDTQFIGGMLDTCCDEVRWFDAERMPASHASEFADLEAMVRGVSISNAHERCRRFETAPLDITPLEAHRHVEARAGDLAQVRPELGHATNAVCIIGRRWRSRGLFLDRRAFLVSYDSSIDIENDILTRTLAAVAPVGVGINLEYFFSVVDSIGYGCGTKLPHNITGLLGVMDGHASDLRTGLPWQMVEIHEPVRLLVVIESTPERILCAVEKTPMVKRLALNEWMQVVAWDPDTGALSVFEHGKFIPYLPESINISIVDRSISWYAGHREHLSPARVLAAMENLPAARDLPS